MEPKKFEPGPMAGVELRADGDRWTLVFVRDFTHPPQKVWTALTDPAQLREWSPFTADRDLSTTGDTTLTMIDSEGDNSVDLPGTVSRAEPPTLLEYAWGTDRLCWELAATEFGTRLTLQHTTEKQGSVPEVAGGWHICLAVAERFLDGNPVGAIVGEDARKYGWEGLRDAYAEKLGIVGTS